MSLGSCTYLDNLVLDLAFNGGSLSAPTLYLGLFTADPTKSGSLSSELDQNTKYTSGYARVAISAGAAGSSQLSSDADLEFSAITTTDTILITHVGLIDASTLETGNMWYYGELTSSVSLTNGRSLKVSTGDLIVKYL